jgi:hypothetical protein
VATLTAARQTEADIHFVEEDLPRTEVGVAITQHVEAVAFGSPSDARRLGAAAVEEHDEALRRLAES